MFQFDLNKIAVTLWFFLGELAICSLMIVDAFTIQSFSAVNNLSFWAWTTTMACGVAAMSGAMVDVIRFVSSMVWPKKWPHRVKLKKLMRENLA